MFDANVLHGMYGCPTPETVEPPKGLVGVIAVKRGQAWEHPAPVLLRADRELETDGKRMRLPNIGWVTEFKIESGLIRTAEGWKR